MIKETKHHSHGNYSGPGRFVTRGHGRYDLPLSKRPSWNSLPYDNNKAFYHKLNPTWIFGGLMFIAGLLIRIY